MWILMASFGRDTGYTWWRLVGGWLVLPVLLGVAWAGLFGCRQPGPIIRIPLDSGRNDELDRRFAAGRQVLAGFDYAQPNAAWHVGDRILYGVHIHKDELEQTRFVLIELLLQDVAPGARVIVSEQERDAELRMPWRVRVPGDWLEVPECAYTAPDWEQRFRLEFGDTWSRWNLEFPKTSIFVAMHVFDEEAQRIGTAFGFAPQRMMRDGFYEVCELAWRLSMKRQREISSEKWQRVFNGVCSVIVMGELLARTPHVAEIFQQIAPTPPLLPLLLGFGDPTVVPKLKEVRPLTGGLRSGGPPTYTFRVPFAFELGGRAMLQFDMFTAPADPPLHLCAGIIGLEGEHAEDAAQWFVVRLLAARRGSGSGDVSSASVSDLGG